MRLIQSATLTTLGTILSGVTLTMPLVSPTLAAGGGSHQTKRMCAKIEYSYKNKAGKTISGTTNPVDCGRNFRQQHNETAERQASREEACKSAWARLPRLQQGDQWLQRSCKPFQQG
jgi:hypothetical protein